MDYNFFGASKIHAAVLLLANGVCVIVSRMTFIGGLSSMCKLGEFDGQQATHEGLVVWFDVGVGIYLELTVARISFGGRLYVTHSQHIGHPCFWKMCISANFETLSLPDGLNQNTHECRAPYNAKKKEKKFRRLTGAVEDPVKFKLGRKIVILLLFVKLYIGLYYIILLLLLLC